MQKIRLPLAYLCAGFLALAACDDDDEGAATDAGADTTRDNGGDGGADATPDTSDSDLADATNGDATNGDTSDATGDPDAPVDPCAIGASVSGTVGAEGLTLELCTATLNLPVGAVDEGTAVTLSVIEPPLAAPFEREFISPVYTVASDAEEMALPGTATIEDTSEEGGYRSFGFYTEDGGAAWIFFEACPQEAGLQATLFFFAPFALMRDINVYPDSPEELGDGALQSQLGDDEPVDWTFDDGYAIHQEGEDGSRSLTLIARRPAGEDGLQQLRVDLSQTSEGVVSVLQISFLDTTVQDGGWSYLEPVHGPLAGENTLAVEEDGGVAGSVTATVHQGELTREMVLTLDVDTEKYAFPPEASCFPEG